MIVIGGGAGAGMHAHADDPPTSAWHLQLRGAKAWSLCPPPPSNTSCHATVLRAGDQLFIPSLWTHTTATLTDGAISLSRLLITPANAAPFAARMQQHCEAGRALSRTSYERLCMALAPCLRRLAVVRDDFNDTL